MAESTSKTISQKIHGTGIAQSGSYPVITAKFTITFTRETPTDPTVSWKITMASRSDILPTSTTASFGYPLFCYVRLNNAGDFYTIIEKNNSQGSNWTSSTYTKIYNKSGSITSTDSIATVTIYTKSRQCMHDNNTGYCYNGTTTYNGNKYTYIKAFDVALPSYVAQSTITYDPNSGQGAPESQIKEYGEDITLSTTTPTFPCSINYHNIINPVTDVLYRPFIEWNTAQDGSGISYAPGATYSTDADLYLYAQWGDATLNPRGLDLQYITVTYNVGEGVTPPTPTEHALARRGYSTEQGSTVVSYEVGTTYNTITTDLDLYPVYGEATVPYATLPAPTKQGYKFEGWYRDAQFTEKVTEDISTTTDITLYAKWTFIPIRYFNGSQWDELGNYVWRFNGTEWEKVAHIYLFDGVEWVDQSVDPDHTDI